MKFKCKLPTIIVIALGLGLPSAFAQQVISTPDQMSTQCAVSPNQCFALVTVQIATLKAQGLTPTALDAQLTAMVAAIASEENLPSNISSEVMRELSIQVSDASVAQQILSIADIVEIGNTIETAALGELASPN